jgi:hypothetical protein
VTPFHRSSLGPVGVAIALALAACVAAPTRSAPKPAVRPASSARPVAVASPTPSKQPSPLPSLGLLIEGQVTVEPAKLLDGKLAESTATGVKLISDNGLGLISDNGLGLIANNGAGVIANNGSTYRVAAAGDGLKPVEGMHVKAIALMDGQVLAGPVATDAHGRYRLGFLKAPGSNIRVVAEVPAKPKDPAFTYATLVPPVPPAPSAAPVVTSDTSRSSAEFVLGVLPARLKPVIDARKDGKSAEEYIKTYEGFADDETIAIMRKMDRALAKAPASALAGLDGSDGQLSRGISERTVAILDLQKPIYAELVRLIDQARVWGLAAKPAPVAPLADQVLEKTHSNAEMLTVSALLIKHGVPTDEAEAYGRALVENVKAIGKDVGQTAYANQAAVLGPLASLVGVDTP